MATYFSGSNIQADGMQTLYLMNPDYLSYADMQVPGNMVLVNPSTGIALQNNNSAVGGQPQQHFISVPFPPAQLQQRPSMGGVENSSGAQQGIASMSLPSHLGNNSNSSWRNMGNEMTSMQTTERPQISNQTFSGQVNGFSYVGQQCGPEISHTAVKRGPISSLLEQQLRINPNGQGLHSAQAHSSTTHGQVLSLSLSPNQISSMRFSQFQGQPMDSEGNCASISQTNSEENMNSADRITSKWSGSLSSFRNSPRDGILGSRILTSSNPSETNKQIHHGSNPIGAVEIPNSLLSSKYFKAAQQLLEEVVSDGKGIKSDKAKHQKSQTWFGTASDKKNNSTEASTNDGTASAITGPSTSTQEVKNEHSVALTAADRQELQMKKAKLATMLDEVDQRYKQYYHQLQNVVSTFEVAAGIGAAKTYTAFPVSKRFRSLRDAIAGQIHLFSKNLGEDDLTSSGKGETIRLRFGDQQLRQQRALQQLGMIQQHAWRPQRGLPERAVSILRAWLFEHFLHPYPKDVDKTLLARQTGLTRSQVSNWFINARVRLWKPMVEEMYLEETREGEAEAQKQDPKTTESEKSKDETISKGGARKSDNEQEQKSAKYMRLNIGTEDHVYVQQTGVSNGGFKSDQATSTINGRNQIIGMDSESDSPVFHEISNNQDTRQEQQKRTRSEIQGSTTFLPSSMTMDVDLKSAEANSQYILGNNKFDSDERHASEDYNLLNNKVFHHDNNESFGSYQIGGLSKYTQESFTPNFSGISGVSLTLGLQHCDDLSLLRTQQNYSSCLGLGLGRRHHLGGSPDDYSSINQSSADHASSNYDNIAMQNRKRFATHSLHDFVT